MAVGTRLINKLRRIRNFVSFNVRSFGRKDKVDLRDETLAGSPGAYKYVRGIYRRLDSDIPNDMLASKTPVAEEVEATLERFDFDQGSGQDFGILMRLAGTAGTAETTEITTVDEASLTAGDYFRYSTPESEYAFYVEIDGSGSGPGLSGVEDHRIAIATGDTAGDVAAALQSAMDLQGDITATVSGSTVTATNDKVGDVTDATDGAQATGFTFNVTQQGTDATGSLQGEVGLRPGDIIFVKEGGLKGHQLEVKSIESNAEAKLEDVATFSGPENNVTCKVAISSEKASFARGKIN